MSKPIPIVDTKGIEEYLGLRKEEEKEEPLSYTMTPLELPRQKRGRLVKRLMIFCPMSRMYTIAAYCFKCTWHASISFIDLSIACDFRSGIPL